MRFLAAAGIAFTLILGASLPVQARDGWREPMRIQAFPQQRWEMAERREEWRREPDAAREERRREWQRERDAERPRERLSPEERRQLRRDIDDYGRDIYRERERGRGRR
ncbi:MAG: hypothetical protein AB1768_19155 [Pseudomonadota bacterium]|jgi:hypothetical protein